MPRLADRTALIVGGTGGIGLATARRFLQEGARVVVAGRAPAPGAEAVATLSGLGPVAFLPVDVTDEEAVAALFRDAPPALGGRLDILYHVAGISGRRLGDGPLHDCTADGWDAVLDLNARGMFLTNREAVRLMRAQDRDPAGLRGTILNMGSVLGWSPSPALFGTYAYAASKGAIVAMTRAAAAMYAPEGIRVNLIAPALIDTPMARRAVADPTIRAYLATKQPIAAGPGSPEDCAEAALFLCEPASRFTTGVVLNVDGGWCLSEGQHPHAPGADS
jgi:NAD(P)-dependent dehydrogenase (short-subunit alcohol dehydrogenase family)